MSLKSQIKSKKQKLIDKKFSKGNIPNLVDLIESSQDDKTYQRQTIEKRSKHSGRFVNSSIESTQYTPNRLNLQKIKSSIKQTNKLAQKTLYSNQKQKNDDMSLLVVDTAEQESLQSERDRTLFSYKIEGKEGHKFISQHHYKDRLNHEIKEIQGKQKTRRQKQERQLERVMNGSFLSEESLKVSPQKQGQKQKAQKQPQRKKVARYFEEQLSDDDERQDIVKCFRCNKKGHIAKNCIQQEPKQACNFCLSQHHHSLCQTSPCFKCCQPGHISQDCKSTGIQCRKCNKRGHYADKCGVYLPLDYHNKTGEDIKKMFKVNDLKKLKCLNYNCKKPDGHFNCFTYNTGKHQQPYSKYSNKITQNRSYQRNRR